MTAGRPPARFAAALERLRADLAAGRFSAGDLLPGERDLAGTLGVSRSTLRRVLATLADEGALTHRQGVGTFAARSPAAPAAPRAPAPDPADLGGLVEAMGRRGLRVTTDELGQATVEPTAEEAMLLGCAPRQAVVRLRRLRLLEGEALAYDEASVPADLCAAPVARDGSLHAGLAAAGLVAVRALQRAQVIVLGSAEAALLAVPAHSPALLVRRTDYRADGRCCLYTRSLVRADRTDLLVEWSGPAARLA